MRNIESYFVIVDLETLNFLGAYDEFVELKNARKFNTFDDAKEFLSKATESFRKECAIYEVDTKVSLKLYIKGEEIKGTKPYFVEGLCVHGADKNQVQWRNGLDYNSYYVKEDKDDDKR